MTTPLDLPSHVENAYRAEAQARGLSLDAVVREAQPTVFEQGLGLFGSPEDAALLDQVVAIAYSEKRQHGIPPLEL